MSAPAVLLISADIAVLFGFASYAAVRFRRRTVTPALAWLSVAVTAFHWSVPAILGWLQ